MLLLGSIVVGALSGLLFVYSSDLPQIRALEDFRPTLSPSSMPTTAGLSGVLPCSAASCLPMSRFPTVSEGRHFHHRGPAFRRALGRGFPARGRRRLAKPAGASRRRGRQHSDDAARRRALSRPLGPQLAPQDPGNHAGHPDRAPLLQAADFHDVLQPDLSGCTATTDSKLRRNIISAGRWANLTLPEAAILAGLIRGPIIRRSCMRRTRSGAAQRRA